MKEFRRLTSPQLACTCLPVLVVYCCCTSVFVTEYQDCSPVLGANYLESDWFVLEAGTAVLKGLISHILVYIRGDVDA